MSLLLFENLISDSFDINVTVSSGTKTDLTEPEKMLNRSIDDAYSFELSEATTVTIEFLGIADGMRCAGLLNASNIGSLTPSFAYDHLVRKSRSYQRQNIDAQDHLFALDELAAVGGLTFTFSASPGVCSIGAAWFSRGIDVEVEPSQSYISDDTANKQRTEGGQVYHGTGNLYEEYNCTLAPLKTSIARGNGDSYTLLGFNRIAKTTGTVIFIPEFEDNLHIYGTQKKPVTFKQIKNSKNNGEWRWSCGLSLTEEL